MTPITVQIQIDDFTFDVEITHLIDQAPDPTCRDSADDFRGIREIEWRLDRAVLLTEEGNDQLQSIWYLHPYLYTLAAEHHDQIESALWRWLEAQREQP